ncbi:ABC transporter ATP-binding protein [Pacificoceanicola onchidii]|uniref:ABC transporter ATP-binding protein n=1 Tax=Pacificoceanicola onchidii TaxID=2562685 RepID=UPI0010A6813B|nr:ABC transporter ATP-binding protein [Pacificoceanicola onchidii]
MAHLKLNEITKTFKNGTEAVRGISFDVADREAVFLLGPSGAGKTTTLRLVAGLEDLDHGQISIGSVDRSRAVPRDRNVAMVYDKHSLFPHLSVRENMAYPLRIRKMDDAEMMRRIHSVSEVLQIEAQLDKMPGQLSGGQQQRVAIGRALVRDADVFLLDEPISHLDAQLRARMRVEFKRLQRDFNATMLYVSHDQLEAMTMADRIVLINKGRIEQIDEPQAMFDRPQTLFAATFIGEPVMNSLPVRLVERDGDHWFEIGTSLVPVESGWINSAAEKLNGTGEFTLGVRPQHLELADATQHGESIVHGVIYAVETLGSRVVFDIEIGAETVRVMTSVDEARSFPSRIGSPIAIRMSSEFFYLFDNRDGRTLLQAPFTAKSTH